MLSFGVMLILFGSDLKVTICHQDVETCLVLGRPAMVLKSHLIEVHCLVYVVFDELFIDLGTVLTIANVPLCLGNALLVRLLYLYLWKNEAYLFILSFSGLLLCFLLVLLTHFTYFRFHRTGVILETVKLFETASTCAITRLNHINT